MSTYNNSSSLTLFWELSTQYLFGFENLSFPAFITEIASPSCEQNKEREKLSNFTIKGITRHTARLSSLSYRLIIPPYQTDKAWQLICHSHKTFNQQLRSWLWGNQASILIFLSSAFNSNQQPFHSFRIINNWHKVYVQCDLQLPFDISSYER